MQPRKRIRVCHIVSRFDVGGMENGVANLLNHHDRARFEPMICCLNGTGTMLYRLRPDVRAINMELPEGQGQLLLGPLSLARLLKVERPDVVHAHGWGGGSFIGAIGARLSRVPVVVNGEHGCFFLRRRQVVLQRAVALLCDTTLSVSQSLKEEIVKNLRISPHRITVIPNGVDTDVFTGDYPTHDLFEPSSQRVMNGDEGPDSRAFVVGCVGSLLPYKNQMLVLHAAREILKKGSIPTLKVLLIGDGPDRAKLQEFSSESGLDGHVVFLGRRDDVPKLLSAIDVLLSVSDPDVEGLSNVILEAMSSRVPVIATKSVGSSEVIHEGINGLFIDHLDTAGLCGKIEFLARNLDELDRMGRDAREFVCTHYSMGRMVAAYEETYMNLLKKRGRN